MTGAPLRRGRHLVVRAAALARERGPQQEDRDASRWSPAELAGRLCELAADAHGALLTLACAMIRDYQRAAEPVAWITTTRDTFFPPDAARGGIDLAALPVVTVPDRHAAARAAERLTRSGAFGLLVLELGARLAIPAPFLGRLARLARRHDTALLCLTTPAPGATLGSLIALRGRAFRAGAPQAGRLRCGIRVSKDRRRGPGRTLAASYHAPHGLC